MRPGLYLYPWSRGWWGWWLCPSSPAAASAGRCCSRWWMKIMMNNKTGFHPQKCIFSTSVNHHCVIFVWNAEHQYNFINVVVIAWAWRAKLNRGWVDKACRGAWHTEPYTPVKQIGCTYLNDTYYYFIIIISYLLCFARNSEISTAICVAKWSGPFRRCFNVLDSKRAMGKNNTLSLMDLSESFINISII